MINKNVEKIFVVFKTHFDIGFTALPSEIKEKYTGEMIPDAIDTCTRSKQLDPGHPYVWTMPSWPLTYVLNQNNQQLERLVREKQIVWHALPFTTHTEFCGLEEFIRGMYMAKGLSEKYGYGPISAKMTDVPGHTWILPTLLNKAGIKFLHLGCNPCSTPPDVPSLFYWEGPDDSRVLTYYSKGDYGSGVFPPEEWPLPIWLALTSTGDNHGAHGPEIIKAILDEVSEKNPDTQVIFGTLDDFYKELMKYELDIPVVKKDLADCWIHGVGSYPEEVSRVRELRNRLSALETVMNLERLGKYEADTEFSGTRALIDKAYENILLFGEHTWGMDTKLALVPEQYGGRVYDKKKFKEVQSSGKFDRIQRSWIEKSDYINKARQFVNAIEENVLKVPGDDCSNYIKVYNTEGYKRDGIIEIKNTTLENCCLFDEQNGDFVYPGRLKEGIYFKVKDVPALSYKSYKIIRDSDAQYKDGSYGEAIAYETSVEVILENEYVKVIVDKKSGNITSLVNKATGNEWVNSSSEDGFGQYVYDIYSKREVFEYVRDYAYDLQDWYLADFGKPDYPIYMKHRTYKHAFDGISFENTRDFGQIVIRYSITGESLEEYGNAQRVTLKLTLWKESKGVDFEYDLKQKQETPCPEAGHFVFPLAAHAPVYRINKMGSVINPSEDIMKDCNHVLYCCEKWVEVSDNNEGILFIPYDTPLLSIGEKGIERYSRDYVPESPDVFFNAFNNQWGTNFPQWIGGDFSYRYRLIPHSGEWGYADAHKAANEAMLPLFFSYTAGSSKDTLQEPGVIEQDMDSAEVVAFKGAEDGIGFILRIREIGGMLHKQTLLLNKNVKAAYICDLLENYKSRETLLEADGGKTLILDLKPFEVVTVRLVY